MIDPLRFKIRPGDHTIITGPNGCGKSSIFRILGNLWPLRRGTLRKPNLSEIFYIPQRPYLPTGSLRDQIIYPHTVQESTKKDEDLIKLLDILEIDYIRTRHNGLDTIKDWNDVLSGGEKQRIAIARLFYHCPKYAILDECTSACSIDIESKIYNYVKRLNITLLTVSHRTSLWKYHKYLLRITAEVSIIVYFRILFLLKKSYMMNKDFII